MSSRIARCMLCLVVSASAAPAWAQAKAPRGPAPAPADPIDADDGRVDAKALVQSGVRLLKQKDYLGALAVFKDAYQRFPSVKLLLNIGTTLKLLGRNAEAANAYQRYLDDPQADPARRAEVKDVLATLDRVLGKVTLELEAGGPPQAEVSINGGEWLPVSSASVVRVDPGEVKVAARRAGFSPAEVAARVGAGEETTVRLALTAIVVPEPEIGDGNLMAPEGGVTDGGGVAAAAAPPRARSGLGLMLRGHFHLSPAGAAALLGPTFDVTSRVEVSAGALIGRFRGGYLGASFAVLPGRIRPLVSAGLLLVSDDGARVAARGAVGAELVVTRNVSVFAELGGEHLFNPPMTVLQDTFVPSAGVVGRL